MRVPVEIVIMSLLENQKRKKINKIVDFIEYYFEKYSSHYNQETIKTVHKKISKTRELLVNSELKDLKTQAKDLINFYEKEKKVVKSKRREFIEAVIIALILALFIREYFVQAFKIPSRSMENTLLVGDHILVWKCYYGLKINFMDDWLINFRHPQRGDIIVFTPPIEEKKDFIKRVVAVGGDTIEIRNHGVILNGRKIKENWIKISDKKNTYSNFFMNKIRNYSNYPPTRVPKGMLFVMGDNRADSYDSRGWGFLSEKRVRGKAFMIYGPWVPTIELKLKGLNPYNIFNRFRWKRFFHIIR